VISTTVLTGPWTFTYPSIYLAHHAITHSKLSTLNEYGDAAYWSTTVPAGVVTLQTSAVYSMRLKFGAFNGSGVDYARRVAKGQFEPFLDLKGWTRTDQRFTTRGGPTVTPFGDDAYEILSFDFGDLQDPVPASLYFNGRTDCWGKQSHCATITGDTYRPMLKLRNKVWASLLPQGFDCQRLQFVDPPLRLQAVEHVDPPQLHPVTTLRQPDASAQTTAEPASQIKSPWSYPTAISANQNAPGAEETKDRLKSDIKDVNGLSNEAPKPGRLPSNTPSFDQDPRLGGSTGGTPHRNLNPLAHQTLPSQAQPDNNDSVRSVKIGSKTVVISYSSGTLLVVDEGTLTLRPGSSATIDGKVVYIGKSEILEDGSMIMALPTTKSGGANGDRYKLGDANRPATYDSTTRLDNFPGSTTKRKGRSSAIAVLPATSLFLAAFLMALLVL
jgi:hypothetical protein